MRLTVESLANIAVIYSAQAGSGPTTFALVVFSLKQALGTAEANQRGFLVRAVKTARADMDCIFVCDLRV